MTIGTPVRIAVRNFANEPSAVRRLAASPPSARPVRAVMITVAKVAATSATSLKLSATYWRAVTSFALAPADVSALPIYDKNSLLT
ncbi:hypothetical protein D3C80_1137380 [compost metagenome]